MRQKKIKVLVVEDSPVALEMLLYVLSSDPSFEIIGTAHNGEEAVAAVRHGKPDVVTMDVQMPRLNGYEATRAIMASCPVPIIVVSSHVDPDSVATTFRAFEAGAVMALRKPVGPGHPEYEALSQELISAVRLMSEVKVVRRSDRLRQNQIADPDRVARRTVGREIRAVAIGASTGGPPVIQQILKTLPADFQPPIFIVQHMAEGFLEGLVEWLDQSCPLKVRMAEHSEFAQPGCVYLAPDKHHLGIGFGGQMFLSDEPTDDGFRPSVSYLFRSMAASYGINSAGVLLTGMGEDGAEGLKLMRDGGALTIAQDEPSCVVFGMPKEAIKLGGVERTLCPEEIPVALLEAVRRPKTPA